MQFTDLQNRAIDSIVEWYGNPESNQIFILHGYAGTGKTTVVNEAVSRLKSKYNIYNVPTMAYTGKAAYVLRNKGNMSAQTVHSAIYTVEENPETGEIKSILNPLGTAAMADLIILDECSMIDHVIAADLKSFRIKILCIGDPSQLPPINGDGAFNGEPDFFLNEIHRQALDNPIIELASMARQGIRLPVGYHKGDVRVLSLTNSTAENIYNPDTQVLCGLNRVRWAVTQNMRERLGYLSKIPMVGEKIICKKNNNQKGIFNGGSGILKKLEIKQDGTYKIDAKIEGNFYKELHTDPYLFFQHFDNGESKRDFKKRIPNEFDWGYCWSVHSSQGSEWDHVTIIDNSSSFRENEHKHRYTGITRAVNGLTILI